MASKVKSIKKELTKEEMIKLEIEELSQLFKNIDHDKKHIADRLIEQAGFMRATLKELQDTINERGAVEWFEQGTQKMWRESPSAKIYNTMIKNYNSTIKQLAEFLPKEQVESDELMDFLSGKK